MCKEVWKQIREAWPIIVTVTIFSVVDLLYPIAPNDYVLESVYLLGVCLVEGYLDNDPM